MRIFLPKKEQKKLIDKILSSIPIKEAAKLCKLSEKTIRDWRREKFSMEAKAVRKLCNKTNTPLPANAEFKNDHWYVANASSAGGIAVLKKYGRIGGDPKYRKKKWYEWWEKEGKYNKNSINAPKPIRKPNFSQNLAEFAGIMLGDGGISQRQVIITLHYKDDKEYGKFATTLIKKLFNVPVSAYLRKENSVINYTISRSELVRFCVNKLGLKKGNKIKQKVDIPKWIKQKNSYSIACVRGLVDTDGCVFTHTYKVNNKPYSYKKLLFTSYSKPLRESVFDILQKNGLHPRLAQSKDVRLDNIADMKRYFKTFGSHNPKHLKRYAN